MKMLMPLLTPAAGVIAFQVRAFSQRWLASARRALLFAAGARCAGPPCEGPPSACAAQVPEGSVINSGDLIAQLELDDPGAVTAAVPYPGGFPELGPPLVHSQGVDYRFKEAYSAAKMILEGVRCLRLVWQWLAVRWVDGKTTVK